MLGTEVINLDEEENESEIAPLIIDATSSK